VRARGGEGGSPWRDRAQVQDPGHRGHQRAGQADADDQNAPSTRYGRPSARVRVRMSKISDETNAPTGSGTSRGWKGWPSGPASTERFTQHRYPVSSLLTGGAAGRIPGEGDSCVYRSTSVSKPPACTYRISCASSALPAASKPPPQPTATPPGHLNFLAVGYSCRKPALPRPGAGHIDQISAQPLPSFDEPPAVRIGGGVHSIWVEGLITERNDAGGLAAGCDEIPPIPGG
jgi:hypothetical protein